MPRRSKPYWKSSHACYYTTINKKEFRLDPDKKKAEAMFHRLMMDRGNDVGTVKRLTAIELCALFVTDASTRVKPGTLHQYRIYLRSWGEFAGSKGIADVKPFHAAAWLASHGTWNQNTKSWATTVIKTWSRWCKKQGYADADPLAELKGKAITRRPPVAVKTIETVKNAVLSQEFRAFIEIAVATGARPGELRTLEADRVNLDKRYAIVHGKSGKRVVYFPESVSGQIRALCEKWPSGPIFRNTQGNPWSQFALSAQMRRARARAGIAHAVPYSCRGVFATEGMRNGVDAAVMSLLLGHKDPSMILRHYASPDQQMLREAIEKATEPK